MAEASLGRTTSSTQRFGSGEASSDELKASLQSLPNLAKPQGLFSAGAKEATMQKADAPRDDSDLKRKKEFSQLPRLKLTHVQEATRLALAQTRNSLIFFAVIAAAALVNSPGSRVGRLARCFYVLQDVDSNGLAGTNWADALFAISALFMIVLARALVMLLFMHKLGPMMGIRGCGKRQVRFAEQTWCFLYYGGLWAVGMVLLRVGGYTWYDPSQLWMDFPHIRIPAPIKAYYLNAIGYWISQLYIIHIEERRRDHYQMFLHHVVTCLLIIGSYVNNYTRIGHIMLVLMDFVDAQLSFAKMLKYLDMTQLCDVAFLAFLVGWVSLRHGLYIYQLYYAYYEAPRHFVRSSLCAPGNPWASSCYSHTKHAVFGALLVILQLITMAWLYFILRVVARVIRGESAEDNRSDESEDDENEK